MANRSARRRRRRGPRILPVLLILILAGAWFLYDQQNRIQTETLEVPSPRLPAAFDGFRVVQISDLHGKAFGADSQRLLAEVAALEPDLIAITGDLVDDPAQLPMIPALARALAAIAPTYYVTGNHEWAIREARTVKGLLEQNGVVPLTNEYVQLERGDGQIVLAGIDDPNGPYDQKSPQALMEEIRTALGDPYILLLAHRNEYVQVYAECGADLTLCGHVHGGIVRLPFTDGLIDNTRRRLFPSYTAGLYPMEGGGVLMVSRGLGNGAGAPRILNRPHLPVLVLRSG